MPKINQKEYEEEPKYIVSNDTGVIILYKKRMHDGSFKVAVPFEEDAELDTIFELTEQEIIEYDWKYMVFAERVEEVDE